MILKSANIKNFRSIKDLQIKFGHQTAILGTNGSGKSTILRALDKFYGQSTSVDPDDFFGRDWRTPIEISLTFTDFSEKEREMFLTRIHNNEMAVVRVFEGGGGRNNGKYYGMTPQCPEFVDIRSAPSASAKRELYNSLRSNNTDFSSLPPASSAERVDRELENWESLNTCHLTLLRDDGQFFGFTNVAKGTLQKATNFVFIPAIRDVALDAVDSRGAVVAKLMELVVRSAVQQRVEIQKWQAEASAQFRDLTDPSKLEELGLLSDDLTRTLQVFYAEAGVGLKWQPIADLSIPLPVADVLLSEDGFEGPVDRKGHGLQRAFIFTLLQHLAKASSSAPEVQSPKNEQAEVSDTSAEQNEEAKIVLPGLILAIEEPELYQHPTKQRHFAKVLTQLSNGSLPGVATNTQIVFASHSSLFVSMERFNEIRLARRRSIADHECKECSIIHSSLENVAKSLGQFAEIDKSEVSIDSLIARLHVVNSEIAEGFFADAVVFVEGPSDKAALMSGASISDIDFESLGIAILEVAGKNNLDRICIIFSQLQIPVYAMWDCDSSKTLEERKEPLSKNLQKFLGCPEAEILGCVSRVSQRYACFEDTLEACLSSEIGESIYLQLLDTAREKFSMRSRKHVQKSPAAMRHVIAEAKSQGKHSKTLSNIVEAIVQLRLDTYTSNRPSESGQKLLEAASLTA